MRRGPFLALVAMDGNPRCDTCYKHLTRAYQDKKDMYFDDVIGYMGILKKWSIFKKSPQKNKEISFAKFVGFKHGKEELHMGLQFLLNGIMSVYYDESRADIKRPGYTAFPKCPSVNDLGEIEVSGLRMHY